MSNILTIRFQSQQTLLVGSVSVSQFTILRQLLRKHDGRLRIKATLMDGGLLEFSEYIKLDDENQISNHVYTFHWQNSKHKLIRRWDNAKHYPQLPHAPHHIHQADGTVEGNPEIPTLAFVLAAIEQRVT